jgi:hypothetical protein
VSGVSGVSEQSHESEQSDSEQSEQSERSERSERGAGCPVLLFSCQCLQHFAIELPVAGWPLRCRWLPITDCLAIYSLPVARSFRGFWLPVAQVRVAQRSFMCIYANYRRCRLPATFRPLACPMGPPGQLAIQMTQSGRQKAIQGPRSNQQSANQRPRSGRFGTGSGVENVTERNCSGCQLPKRALVAGCPSAGRTKHLYVHLR